MRTFILAVALACLAAPTAFADKQRVVVTETTIELGEPIYFELGKPVIKKESFPILDSLVAVLAGDKHLAVIEIQSHTDERGDAKYNLAISDQRARAVKAYLVDHGIDDRRLQAKGYGESQPLDNGHDEQAWAKNRRTAFVIRQRTQ